jgi:tetratricopeptide (TPR) repeat protein
MLLRTARFDAAEQAFGKALDSAPGQPDRALSHLLRAEARLKLGRHQAALADLNLAEQLGQRSAAFHKTRGLLRAAQGNYRGAVDDYTHALDLRPDTATYLNRGWLYLLIFRSQRLALADFEDVLRSDRHNAEAYLGRGNALILLRPVQEAIADVTEGLRLAEAGPASPRLLCQAARVYAQATGQVRAAASNEARKPDKSLPFQDRAVALLRQALHAVPPNEQAAFWREHIASDVALAAIWRSQGYLQLQANFAAR